MICPDYLIARLEKKYTEIEQNRMQGMPVINNTLTAKAIGFTPWNDCCLGVMLTPWFMNLMLLPTEEDNWSGIAFGKKVTHEFPSGLYDFTMGYEEGIGPYQMCSLFSPMFEFTDQNAAIATAQAVLDGLMNVENRDEISSRANEIERIWKGEETGESSETTDKLLKRNLPEKAGTKMKTEDYAQDNATTFKERLEKPVSRRKLLRADFLRDN